MKNTWRIFHWKWFITVCLDFVNRHTWWDILQILLSECCRFCRREIVVICICLITERRDDVDFILWICSASECEDQFCFMISSSRTECSVCLRMSRRRMKVLIDCSTFIRESSNLDMKNVNDLAIYVIVLFRIWFLQQTSETMFKLKRSLVVFEEYLETSYRANLNIHCRCLKASLTDQRLMFCRFKV